MFSALLSVTTVNYLLSVVSLVLFYLYYTHSDGCTENKVFISINMLLCVAASLLSILPQIQVQTTLPFLPHTFGTKTSVFEAPFLNFKAKVTQLLRGHAAGPAGNISAGFKDSALLGRPSVYPAPSLLNGTVQK